MTYNNIPIKSMHHNMARGVTVESYPILNYIRLNVDTAFSNATANMTVEEARLVAETILEHAGALNNPNEHHPVCDEGSCHCD